MNVVLAIFAFGMFWCVGAYVTYVISARLLESDLAGVAMGIFFPFSLVVVACFLFVIPLLEIPARGREGSSE